ncbi:MAG: SDR family NAD(P)-dependent oxidoreductase [Magnetococcales bacterium]|nr:SDR family NAD(P)-dependent oxidoreductase [Magnetococcales bacterium]
MLLKNRIALVTGAGSGLGRAIAIAYAQEGATVILLGRRQEALEESYDLIADQGGSATIVPLDLEKELPRVSELAATIAQRFGLLDILVNNAAQLGALTPMTGYEPAMWESILRVNLTAPFFLTRELMPLLKRSNNASVINLSSGVALHGRAYWGAYAASKAALMNLTETWAQEMTNNIVRLNSVNPGGTATDMRATAFPGEDPATLPSPEQVVPIFLYLASHHAKEIQGRHLDAREWMHWTPPKEKPSIQ